jgi:hypothetical protein
VVIALSDVSVGKSGVTYDFLEEKLSEEGEVNAATLQGVLGVMLREGLLLRRHKSPHQGDIFSEVSLTVPQKRNHRTL